MNQRPVDVGGEESRIGVPVHQRVDLQLGVFKRVRRRVLHLPVDHFSNPGVQAHLEENTVQLRGGALRLHGSSQLRTTVAKVTADN